MTNTHKGAAIKIDRDKAVLLVIDMQAKVLDLVPDHDGLLQKCLWLTDLATDLDVPVLLSTHYAKGLGEAVAELRERVPEERIAHKVHFSCVEDDCFRDMPDAARRQWILCGIEAHACVMLTALDLAAQGKDVFVVGDAIGSRSAHDRQMALERMAPAGVTIVSREMVFFELLRKAGTQIFKECSRKYLR